MIGLAILSADDVVALELHGVGILGSDINLGIGELADAVAVVVVLVGNEDLGHLLGFVACNGEGLHIVGHFIAHIERSAILPGRSCKVGFEAGVNQYHLVARVDEKVLQTAAVDDLGIEGLASLFAAKGERLVHETAIKHADCFDFHNCL